MITIRKIKRPGATSTWQAELLEETEHGLWLFTPPRAPVHNVKDGEEWHSVMGQGTEPGFLWLMPRDQWWFGAWWTRPDRDQLAVDACTVPTLIDGVWTWIDLELDVVRDGNGNVWVEDEDEFADAIAGGHIPPAEQTAARAVTDDIVRQLTGRTDPFGDEGWERYRSIINKLSNSPELRD